MSVVGGAYSQKYQQLQAYHRNTYVADHDWYGINNCQQKQQKQQQQEQRIIEIKRETARRYRRFIKREIKQKEEEEIRREEVLQAIKQERRAASERFKGALTTYRSSTRFKKQEQRQMSLKYQCTEGRGSSEYSSRTPTSDNYGNDCVVSGEDRNQSKSILRTGKDEVKEGQNKRLITDTLPQNIDNSIERRANDLFEKMITNSTREDMSSSTTRTRADKEAELYEKFYLRDACFKDDYDCDDEMNVGEDTISKIRGSRSGDMMKGNMVDEKHSHYNNSSKLEQPLSPKESRTLKKRISPDTSASRRSLLDSLDLDDYSVRRRHRNNNTGKVSGEIDHVDTSRCVADSSDDDYASGDIDGAENIRKSQLINELDLNVDIDGCPKRMLRFCDKLTIVTSDDECTEPMYQRSVAWKSTKGTTSILRNGKKKPQELVKDPPTKKHIKNRPSQSEELSESMVCFMAAEAEANGSTATLDNVLNQQLDNLPGNQPLSSSLEEKRLEDLLSHLDELLIEKAMIVGMQSVYGVVDDGVQRPRWSARSKNVFVDNSTSTTSNDTKRRNTESASFRKRRASAVQKAPLKRQSKSTAIISTREQSHQRLNIGRAHRTSENESDNDSVNRKNVNRLNFAFSEQSSRISMGSQNWPPPPSPSFPIASSSRLNRSAGSRVPVFQHRDSSARKIRTHY